MMSHLAARCRMDQSPGPEGIPNEESRHRKWLRHGSVLFWSVFLAGSAALLIVVVRMLMTTVLVAPAVGGPFASHAATSPGQGATSPTAPSSSTSGTASKSPDAPVPCGASVCPVGVAGRWTVSFDDEFDGSSLDRSKWAAVDGQLFNGVTSVAANVAVADGCLILTLSDGQHGAHVSSAPFDGAGSGGYLLPVGSYTEARVFFPGNGPAVYNWPAWWTGSGPSWPDGGEYDIAEAMDTLWTVYHGAKDAKYGASIPGVWTNQFHEYGLYRAADHADVYWDGKKIATYTTADNGAGQALLLTVGKGPYGGALVSGAASRVKIDYVRAWRPTQ